MQKKNIIKESLNKNGKIYIMPSINDCIEFINKFAPEHLEIFLKIMGNMKKILRMQDLYLLEIILQKHLVIILLGQVMSCPLTEMLYFLLH